MLMKSIGYCKLQTGQLKLVVCKQMEQVIAGCLRQVWEMSVWLYEGQHGFRLRYTCEIKWLCLSGYRALTGRGSEDRRVNNRLSKGFQFSST